MAWHVGWKIYRSIVGNVGNHAKIFGHKIKILRFAFERHVKPMTQPQEWWASQSQAPKKLNCSCMLLEVAGIQGCYRGKHRNNWRCARAVHALCENAPIAYHNMISI